MIQWKNQANIRMLIILSLSYINHGARSLHFMRMLEKQSFLRITEAFSLVVSR